jgi:hypothetical protein
MWISAREQECQRIDYSATHSYSDYLLALFSAIHASIRSLSSGRGSTMLSFKGWRLKGSVSSLSKCCAIVERSTMLPEVGSLTGSRKRVFKMGSRNSSGASPTSASKSWSSPRMVVTLSINAFFVCVGCGVDYHSFTFGFAVVLSVVLSVVLGVSVVYGTCIAFISCGVSSPSRPMVDSAFLSGFPSS